MSKFTEWRAKNPKTYLVAIAVVATLVGVAIVLGYSKVARAATASVDCPAPAVWTFNAATNTLACTSAVVTPPPVDPPPVVTPPNTCPAGTLWIKNQFGNVAIDTAVYGDFGQNIMVVEIKVPTDFAGTTVRTSSWGEYGSGPVSRTAVLSKVACDFTNANALKTSTGIPARSPDNATGFAMKYKAGGANLGAVDFVPGATYYLNVKNYYSDGSPSCPNGVNCRMRGGLPR